MFDLMMRRSRRCVAAVVTTVFAMGLLLCSASAMGQAAGEGKLGLGLGSNSMGDLAVTQVMPGGPGEKAGLKAGDVIVSINGKDVEDLNSADELVAALAGPVGSVCKLTIERGDREMEISVTRASLTAPGNNPQNPQQPMPQQPGMPQQPMPQTPGQPGMPGMPQQPMPQTPGQPGMPQQPIPQTPGQPGMPGQPQQPMPQQPGIPGQPGMPQQPMPQQPGMPGMPPMNPNNPGAIPQAGADLPPNFQFDVEATEITPLVAPQVLQGPAPAMIKKGTQLVYYLGSATIPGAAAQLQPTNKPGQYYDPKTGQQYDMANNPTSAGYGWGVFDTAYADGKVISGNFKSYTLDVNDRKSGMLIRTNGGVFPAGFSHWWASPQVLAALPDQNANGLMVSRMQWPLNGKTYNAIAIRSYGGAIMDDVYDLDTGLLIFRCSITQGQGGMTPGPNGQTTPTPGASTVSTEVFLNAQQVNVPWANDPAPDWVSKFSRLSYDGQKFSGTPAQNFWRNTGQIHVDVQANGTTPNWARTISSTQTNDPLESNKAQLLSGGGLSPQFFIPPQGLARLQQGQEIFRDNQIGYALIISQADANTVTLSETGQSYRSDAIFDRNSGMLIGVNSQTGNNLGVYGFQIRLSGQQ